MSPAVCVLVGFVVFVVATVATLWQVSRRRSRTPCVHCAGAGRQPTPPPFVSDPDFECVEYVEGEPPLNGGHCETDGHYLCSGCRWNLHRVDT